MSKKIINVGTSPGNQGDGDTLRDAFVKVQANFDELYTSAHVTDTSLSNHSDPGTSGTIARALADVAASGGGTVVVGPGTFNITNSLVLGENVILKGVGRRATTIKMTGAQDSIRVTNQYGAIESLRVQMPTGATTNGISVTKSDVHLKDIAIAGGDLSSWAINVDGANVVYLSNIRIGGSGNKFTGNGIIFQNSALLPYNFGDAKLSKIDITLEAGFTTGLKFYGPNGSSNKINNILCSQVEIIGTGPLGGCIGVHLSNTARIVLLAVDLEQLGTAVLEEGGGAGSSSKNNVFIGTFAIGVGVSYASSGTVLQRLFIGCDNLILTNTSDNDTVIPAALWLNDAKGRIWSNDTRIQFDDGVDTNGIQFDFASTTPTIRTASSSSNAQLSLGKPGTKGVQCLPGLVLPVQSTAPTSPPEGMLVYFASGVVGASRGLYQYRLGSWVFIN